jgi:hypothetical protein
VAASVEYCSAFVASWLESKECDGEADAEQRGVGHSDED